MRAALSLLGLLTLLVSCGSGPTLTESERVEAIPSRPQPVNFISDPDEAFRGAEKAYLEGDTDALGMFDTYLNRWPRSSLAPLAHLYSGLCLQTRKTTQNQAIAHFEQARSKGDGAIRARALLQIGYIRYQQKGYDAALHAFLQAFQRAVDDETRVEARLEYGRTLIAIGRGQEGRQQLKLVDKVSTPAHYRKAAQALLGGDVDRGVITPAPFTVQIGAFSSRANASKELTKLRKFSITARLLANEPVDGYYRVVSGRFATRAKAKAHCDWIQKLRGGERPRIYP